MPEKPIASLNWQDYERVSWSQGIVAHLGAFQAVFLQIGPSSAVTGADKTDELVIGAEARVARTRRPKGAAQVAFP
jgi:hypothetical protein